MSEILAFSLIALLLVISLGSNGVLILKTTSSRGSSASMFNIFGLTVATFFHGAFSIFGLSALLLQSAELFFLIKVLSAAYLFYIGIKSILSSFSHIPSVSREEVKDVSVRGRSSYFVESFLTQILNPKVSMFYLAAFPQFISPEAFAYMDAFVLVSIYAGIIFIWFTGVIYVLRRMRYVANSSTVGQWIQRLSGTAMVYFSSLVLSQK